VTLSSGQAIEGEPVRVTVQIVNGGRGGALASTVRAFDSNGVPFGPAQAVPELAPGATQQFALQLDTTGHGGSQQLFVVVDAEGAVDETREDDNRFATALQVIAPPAGPQLFVAPGSVATTPSTVDRLPTNLQVNALVGNLGLADASQVEVGVYVRDQLANVSQVDMPAGSRFQLAVSVAVPPGPGPIPVRVVIDPNGLVPQTRRDNSSDTTLVPVVSAVDLVAADLSVEPSPVQQGDSLAIQYTVRNIGTVDAVAATVQVLITDSQDRVAASQIETLTLASGAMVPRSMPWRASVAGTLRVSVRAAHVAERDLTNNAAETLLEVNASTLPNLAVRSGDVTIAPTPVLEGKTATVTATIQNTGETAAGAFDVDFWLGDPASGGQLLGTRSLAGLGAGGAQQVSQSYTVVGSKSVPIVVRADPRDVVAEFDESDNVAVVTPDVLPLPDLVLADVKPADPFPRLGDSVPVSVKVINSGGQQAEATAVTLYLGPPEGGGTRLGSTSVPLLDAGQSSDITFTWNALAAGAQKLVAIVNESGAVTEARLDNNRAERAVMVQAGDLALSNPYLSPNGDDVKDTTDVFYRLAAPSAVVLDVRNEEGKLVRSLSSDSALGNGALTWDGRDASGRVVKDGAYALSLRTAGEEPFTVLGTLTAIVDDNRSPLESAIGTGLLHVQDLDTHLPQYFGGMRDQQFAPMSDDSGVVQFDCSVDAGGVEHCHFQFEPISGDEPTPFTPVGHDIGQVWQVAVSPDSSTLAYLEGSGCGYWCDGYELMVYSVRDGMFSSLTNGAVTSASPLVFSPDSKQILYFIDSWTSPYELRIANVDGSGERTLVPDIVGEYAFSPDGKWVSYVKWDGSIALVRPDGSERHTVVPPDQLPLFMVPRLWARHAWLPDGRIAFVAAERGIVLVDPETGEVRSAFEAPEADRHQFDEDIQIAASSQGDAIAFTYTPGAYWGYQESQILVNAPAVGALPRVLYKASGVNGNLSDMGWSPQGTFIYAWEGRSSNDASHIALTTLANLTGQMSVARRPHAFALTFSGTASDAHFERYEIGVRPASSTGPFQVIARSSQAVIGGTFAEWVPPSPGVYEGVLTVSDLAGNIRQLHRRFAWSDTVSIANVTRLEEYISPNGDGVQDAATIRYSVSSPISTEFQIVDGAGKIVRRMALTHVQAGDYTTSWDGKDDQGLVVPDGEYTLVADAARLRIIVDTQPPTVDFALLDNLAPLGTEEDSLQMVAGIPRNSTCSSGMGAPHGVMECPNDVCPEAPQVFANLAWRATDPHLQWWALESGSGVMSRGQTQSVELQGVPVLQARTLEFRVRAVDLAGNTTVTPLFTPTEHLWIVAAGGWEALDECESGFLDLGFPTPYRQIHRLDALNPVSNLRDDLDGMGINSGAIGDGLVAFGYETSVREGLVSYEVLYRIKALGGSFARTSAQDRNGVGVWWRLSAPIKSALAGGARVEVRLEAKDSRGRTFTSQSIVIGLGIDGTSDRVLFECPASDTSGVVKLNLFAGKAIIPAGSTVTLTPLDDLGPPLVLAGASAISPDGTQLSVPRELATGCRYRVDVSAQLAGGGTANRHVNLNLCSLSVQAVRLEGTVATITVAEDVWMPIESLDVYVPAAENPDQWIPAGHLGAFEGTSPALRLELGDRPRCSQLPVRFVAHLVGGGNIDSSQQHGTDKYDLNCPRPPAPSIDLPCAKVVVGKPSRQTVAPLCSAVQPTYAVPVDAESSRTLVDLKMVLETLSGAPVQPLSIDRFTPGPSVSAMAIVDTASLATGDYVIAAEARDDLGFVSRGQAPFPLVVDRTLPVVRVDSPANGERVNPMSVQNVGGTTSRFIDVQGLVSDEHLEGYWIQLRDMLGVWRTAFEKHLTAPMALTVSGLLGRVDVAGLPAGVYGVRVIAADVSGSSGCSPETALYLEPALAPEIDNTPPIARIDSPRDTFLVNGAGFVGTAADANLASYRLEVSDGTPDTAFRFLEVATGTQSVEHGSLGILAGLPADGVYTARLRVVDRAGNESVDVTAFVVDTTPPRPPPALQVVLRKPSDGLLTWTASTDPDVVGYRIFRAVGSGQAVALTPSLVQGNAYTDARLGDGVYRYTVLAVDAAGLQSAPSSEARLVVDTTPPLASLMRPVAGTAASGVVEVIGTAFSRDDFREYRLSSGEGAMPAVFALIRRSPAVVVSGTLGFIDTTSLAQGSVQTLRLESEDLSGNIAEARVSFVVDNSPPAAPVLVSATAQGTSVTLMWKPNAEPDLAGYVVYRNAVPLLPTGTSLDDLARALLPVAVTSHVDAAVPDGSYAYQVQAIDTAGNASALSNVVDVVLESGAPKARIGAPEHLARITGPVTVIAECDVLDVASVQVEVRAAGDSSFSPLGAPGHRVPYPVELDPTLLSSPVIELRAVATDRAGNVDPAPASAFLFYDPPLTAPIVHTLTGEGTTTVTWADMDPPGRLAGFGVQRPSVDMDLAPYPSAPKGHATATATTTGSADSAYDGWYWTYWGTQTLPADWTLLLDSPTLVDSVDVRLLCAGSRCIRGVVPD
jgi:subtilase family serine protease